MKKYLGVTAILVAMSAMLFLGNAQTRYDSTQGQNQPQSHGGMNGMNGMDGAMDSVMSCKMMMHMMMIQNMVGTSDGGAIVANGLQLMKFDRNLNLVKSVAIPMDSTAMQRAMSGMMRSCPTMKHAPNMRNRTPGQRGQMPDTTSVPPRR